MRQLDEIRQVTLLHSLSKCGVKALAGAVSVGMKESGSGTFAGVFRCASVWSCPECSPMVRADRASNFERWAVAWMRAGHGLGMATLTSRHGKHAQLSTQIEGTAGAWRRMLQSRWWRTFRDKHGIVGAARAVEMTHSWANSWHVHIHAVLWTETPMDADTAREIETALYARWRDEIKHAKLGQPSRKHGVRVDPCTSQKHAADVAKYVVKVQDKDEKGPARSLGNELLRGDDKDGRMDGRSPFEIMRRALAETAVERAAYTKAARRARRRPDDAAAQAAADALLAEVHTNAEMLLWLEYESATKGHRMLTWTGPIKDRLAELVDVTERAAEAVVDESSDTTAILVQVQPRAWTSIAFVPGRRGQLRQAVTNTTEAAVKAHLDPETEARAAVAAILESWGLKVGTDFSVGREDQADVVLDPSNRVDMVTGLLLEPELPVPPQRKDPKPRVRWQTPADLHAEQKLLGISPRDNVRPARAARKAKGLPVSV